MSIKINGKPFDFDSTELYEGERPSASKVNDYLLVANFLLWGYVAYPYVVKLIRLFFLPLMHYFGIPG